VNMTVFAQSSLCLHSMQNTTRLSFLCLNWIQSLGQLPIIIQPWTFFVIPAVCLNGHNQSSDALTCSILRLQNVVPFPCLSSTTAVGSLSVLSVGSKHRIRLNFIILPLSVLIITGVLFLIASLAWFSVTDHTSLSSAFHDCVIGSKAAVCSAVYIVPSGLGMP